MGSIWKCCFVRQRSPDNVSPKNKRNKSKTRSKPVSDVKPPIHKARSRQSRIEKLNTHGSCRIQELEPRSQNTASPENNIKVESNSENDSIKRSIQNNSNKIQSLESPIKVELNLKESEVAPSRLKLKAQKNNITKIEPSPERALSSENGNKNVFNEIQSVEASTQAESLAKKKSQNLQSTSENNDANASCGFQQSKPLSQRALSSENELGTAKSNSQRKNNKNDSTSIQPVKVSSQTTESKVESTAAKTPQKQKNKSKKNNLNEFCEIQQFERPPQKAAVSSESNPSNVELKRKNSNKNESNNIRLDKTSSQSESSTATTSSERQYKTYTNNSFGIQQTLTQTEIPQYCARSAITSSPGIMPSNIIAAQMMLLNALHNNLFSTQSELMTNVTEPSLEVIQHEPSKFQSITNSSPLAWYSDLSRDCGEYQHILKMITNRRIKVDGIKKIHNKYLEMAYELKKEEKHFRLGYIDEVLLFHGTKFEHVKDICTYNFDWRKVSRYKFGKGVSFSPNAMYASEYSDEVENKVMIIAKVLIHNSIQGQSGMILPPYGYDTTQKGDGIVIVKYEDNEFYPCYLMYYHRK